MNIFVDTEFTGFFDDVDLISIGLVSSDGRAFYGEVLDFDRSRCTDFVRKTVLPLLGKRPGAAMSQWQLSQAVVEWLEQFADDEPTICFDYEGDWDHLWDLLDRDMPGWLKRRNTRGNLDSDLFAQYFLVTGLEPHHALNDAQSNRFVFMELEPS